MKIIWNWGEESKENGTSACYYYKVVFNVVLEVRLVKFIASVVFTPVEFNGMDDKFIAEVVFKL